MPKWLRGKNGKFAGSIGDGKSAVPTSAVVPGQGIRTRSARIEAARQADYQRQWEQMQRASNTPGNAGSSEPNAADMAAFREALEKSSSGDFQDRLALRQRAETVASTRQGQVEVLRAAEEAAQRPGGLATANTLMDAAATGRKAHDAAVAAQDWSGRVAAPLYGSSNGAPKTHFDYTDDAVEDFQRAGSTPTTVPAAGNSPAKELQFNPKDTEDALVRVAGGVLYGKTESRDLVPSAEEVYPAELRDRARKYASGPGLVSDPRDSRYIRADVAQFVTDVRESQRKSAPLVRERVRVELRRAESIAYLGREAGSDPFARA